MARVAIVTGGTRGIGEAISVALKNAGMTVAANYAGNEERAKAFTERTGIQAFKSALGSGNPFDVVMTDLGMPYVDGSKVAASIKELSRRWYPRVFHHAPEKNGGHRALADIKDSVAELRYYREAVFVPQPGPDSATAKEIGARHTAWRREL